MNILRKCCLLCLAIGTIALSGCGTTVATYSDPYYYSGTNYYYSYPATSAYVIRTTPYTYYSSAYYSGVYAY